MISVSVAQAMVILPKLKLPVLLISMHDGWPVGISKVATEQEYCDAACQIMTISPRVQMVITSETGDDPRLDPDKPAPPDSRGESLSRRRRGAFDRQGRGSAMKIITKGRQCGKTEDAIVLANHHDAVLVVANEGERMRIAYRCKRVPITFDEMIRERLITSLPPTRYVIDNADWLLRYVLGSGAVLVAITLNDDDAPPQAEQRTIISSPLVFSAPIFSAPLASARRDDGEEHPQSDASYGERERDRD